ncbi:MAG: hypothetical protein O7G85_00085 [Planctomycetota bacterium]|nr:hypothetical protein [Planctomycetota bacterium]
MVSVASGLASAKLWVTQTVRKSASIGEERRPERSRERVFSMISLRMGKPLRVVLSVAALSLSCGLTAQADIVIDDFNSVGDPNPWPAFQTSLGNNLITEVNLAGVLGGTRQTTVFGGSFVSGSDLISARIDSGQLSYNSTSGAIGALGLFYSGFPGGLMQDFSNETGIRIDFAEYGFSGENAGKGPITNLTVDIFNGSNNASLSRSISSFGAQSVFFDFNLFSGIEFLNMNEINRISISINPLDSGLDFVLNSIKTVTIPTPGVLAMMGMAGLASMRRRRRA